MIKKIAVLLVLVVVELAHADGKPMTYVLSYAEVTHQLDHLETLLTQASIEVVKLPADKKGAKITNITKGSLFTKMHLQNNDVILEVDGKTHYGALEAFQDLQAIKAKSKTKLDLMLKRAKVNYRLHYEIK